MLLVSMPKPLSLPDKLTGDAGVRLGEGSWPRKHRFASSLKLSIVCHYLTSECASSLNLTKHT